MFDYVRQLCIIIEILYVGLPQMTPKEAFRKLSHKFHGKGPGKMKQEKKQKQFQEELKLKQMNAGDTPLKSMERIREAHARSHAPYIVISGHIKPGYGLSLQVAIVHDCLTPR